MLGEKHYGVIAGSPVRLGIALGPSGQVNEWPRAARSCGRAGKYPKEPNAPRGISRTWQRLNPWRWRVDVSLARSLGFQPEVPTVYQASRENKL
jgi:hypothetical protein